MSKAKLGRAFSTETREKLSKAKLGNQYRKGCHHSDETKEKMSKAKMGKPRSDETKEKIED
jgi:hypothetical protein